MGKTSLGILGYDSFHFAVANAERSRNFYLDTFDFAEIAKAGADLVARSGQTSFVVKAGEVVVVVSSAVRPEAKASRFLRKHPCGVMSLSFQVRDAEHAMKELDRRGATVLSDLFVDQRDGGVYKSFEIATPLGDLNYRFIERKEYPYFAPGFENVKQDPSIPTNKYGITSIDHVTSNMRTMAPFLFWLEHVMGMEPYWDVTFHTEDVAPEKGKGSGLKSKVMWDPESGIRFANNEPLKPYFNASQIAKFVEDNAGAGVQHAALLVPDLISVVRSLKNKGVRFLKTPGAYYDELPKILAERGVTNLAEPMDVLRELEILVDGRGDKYMLQIFLEDAALLYNEPQAGPFFFEIIQRVGHPGFGEGNFRALFEAIEREQQKQK